MPDRYARTFTGRVTDPELVGHHHGQSDFVVHAVAPDGRPVGRLEYSTFGGRLHVNNVEVHPDHRRAGVATSLYERMLAEHPALPIAPATRTPDGAAFRSAFDAGHADRVAPAPDHTPPAEHTPDEWDRVLAARRAVADGTPGAAELDALMDRMNDHDNAVLAWSPGDPRPRRPDVPDRFARVLTYARALADHARYARREDWAGALHAGWNKGDELPFRVFADELEEDGEPGAAHFYRTARPQAVSHWGLVSTPSFSVWRSSATPPGHVKIMFRDPRYAVHADGPSAYDFALELPADHARELGHMLAAEGYEHSAETQHFLRHRELARPRFWDILTRTYRDDPDYPPTDIDPPV